MVMEPERPDHFDLEEVYRAYYRTIYNYIYARLLHRETAEDLTADVFVAAATAAERFSAEKGSLTAWLFTIARNCTISYFMRASTRREKASGVDPAQWDRLAKEAMVDLSGQDTSLLSPESQRAEYILTQISDKEREMLALRYGMGLSNDEIGRLIGISANAVSQRFRRLLMKCRQLDRKK